MAGFADILRIATQLRSGSLDNYIVPGLVSSLLGRAEGNVRLFEASRMQRSEIAPHTHRYDFVAMVLQGHVLNTRYREIGNDESNGPGTEKWMALKQTYGGQPGSYPLSQAAGVCDLTPMITRYSAGEIYEMRSEEIHSIVFSQNAVVLMLEGPQLKATSVVYVPYMGRDTRFNYAAPPVAPWMFLPKDLEVTK
jgi:hypothetical protein